MHRLTTTGIQGRRPGSINGQILDARRCSQVVAGYSSIYRVMYSDVVFGQTQGTGCSARSTKCNRSIRRFHDLDDYLEGRLIKFHTTSQQD